MLVSPVLFTFISLNIKKRKEESIWTVCVPSAGLSLQQHPGAAWVVVTNSSISDFVAGGEPLPLYLRAVAAIATSQWLPG